MNITRAASIPLVLHDPYFSIWSSADRLYDADPVHWCGKRQQLRGYVTVDGVVYSFLGDREFHEAIPQKSVDVTATSTAYTFENEKIVLTARFTSPLLLDDFTLVSRPCTYIDFAVEKKEDCEVLIDFLVSSDLVSQKEEKLVGCSARRPAKKGAPAFSYAQMGKAAQRPLGGSGDNVTIDWGYVYAASADENAVCAYDEKNHRLSCRLPLEKECGMILAFDDLLSINYFGQWRKAYWTKEYDTILDAVGAAFADRAETLTRAAALDAQIEELAKKAGGEEYAFLCSMSYRHAVAAHKLITDEKGEIIFLSKENDSNGCIGTVDVSYPSVPLFLLYNTEYVKGMLRPVFEFAARDVWEYDFAPHDVGRYPYAWGQVYGMDGEKGGHWFPGGDGEVFPAFYQYPAGTGIYDFKYQMPVEECGNMLIMTAAVCGMDGNAGFARPHMEVLKKWMKYLLEYGADPGEQLCTDDFAGHLSHNVNLSAKAIMGVEAYARLAGQLGQEAEALEYHQKAAAMAADWEKRAICDDHYVLAFGNPDTWSLKYNLVWDRVWDSGLFSNEVYEKELAYYVKKTNAYGTPLDSRRSYTKSDWILWCAAMAKDAEEANALIAPVAAYLKNTESRVPFSDWYETETGRYCHFIARSVQGGIFMPALMKKYRDDKK
ncbi:MAG: glutaminase domain-containing protein [Eisenbergiella sp.]